jgi:nucleotide-binding universal stress UspA family protein
VQHVARTLEREVGHRVDFDVLHRSDPADALVDDAAGCKASLIAASTHGETGLRRVVAGSVTMGLVHRAACPVLVYRPLQLKDFVH